MRTSNRTPHSPLTSPHSFLLRIRAGKWNIILAVIGLLTVALFSVRTAPALAIRPVGAETVPVAQARGLGLLSPAGDSVLALVSHRRPTEPERLVDILQHIESPGELLVAMTALEQTGNAAVPALVVGLASADPGTRVAVSQVLGWQRAGESVAPLMNATFDPQSMVREAALSALGEIGHLQGLPRIQQLKAIEGNYWVQQAAYLAEQRIHMALADELGIGPSELQATAVATSGEPAYAVTSQGVYAKKAGRWSQLANLPFDGAELVATDTGGQVVFIGGTQGLARSTDAGNTWELVQVRLATDSPIRATALTIAPRDSSRIFVALAGTSSREPTSGIYASEDGGDAWYMLPYAPHDYVTNSLSVDSGTVRYLYGVTRIGVWRYLLPGNGARSGTN